jgi:hypothetical protein
MMTVEPNTGAVLVGRFAVDDDGAQESSHPLTSKRWHGPQTMHRLYGGHSVVEDSFSTIVIFWLK